MQPLCVFAILEVSTWEGDVSDGYARLEIPNPESWGTITHGFLYDAAPKQTALDFVRASNVWPAPYPGLYAWFEL